MILLKNPLLRGKEMEKLLLSLQLRQPIILGRLINANNNNTVRAMATDKQCLYFQATLW